MSQLMRVSATFRSLGCSQAASEQVNGRAQALSRVAEKYEKGLDVLGATAIEDKLQVMRLHFSTLHSLCPPCTTRPASHCSFIVGGSVWHVGWRSWNNS